MDTNLSGRNSLGDLAEVQILTAAHGTVIDFLTTQDLTIGTEAPIRFTRATINIFNAEMCLTYLQYFHDNNIKLTEEVLPRYPFARLCAELWDDFYREAIVDPHERINMTRINSQVMRLMTSPEETLQWVQLCDPHKHEERVNFENKLSSVYPPIYYAALLGLPDIVAQLMSRGDDLNITVDSECGTPLKAACYYGRSSVVALLLEQGANPVSIRRHTSCPLAAAIEGGKVEIIKMLLARSEVDVNCREFLSEPSIETYDEFNPSMVYVAVMNGSSEALECLLSVGADPNIEGGRCHTALQLACVKSDGDTVAFLLESGANVKAYGGLYESALQAACRLADLEIVKILIAAGAEVDHIGKPIAPDILETAKFMMQASHNVLFTGHVTAINGI